MLETSLLQGFEIIGVVTVMSIVVSPVLCWVLPDRTHTPEQKSPA